MKEFIIIREKNADKKTQAAQEVLFNLPEWFGLEKETRKYIDIASTLPMWVAKDVENKILGFITLSETSKDTVEIHCMAVKKRYHRKGIGKLLIESVETYSIFLFKSKQLTKEIIPCTIILFVFTNHWVLSALRFFRHYGTLGILV